MLYFTADGDGTAVREVNPVKSEDDVEIPPALPPTNQISTPNVCRHYVFILV